MNAFLYVLTTVIWGGTWLAISLQSGKSPVLTAIFYRFLIATTIMFSLSLLTKNRIKIDKRNLILCLIQGLCMYSVNFVCFYSCAKYITGGMVSLIFSIVIIFNVIGCKLFFRETSPKRFSISAILGVSGLLFIILKDFSLDRGSWIGILLCILGTMLFSLGNMIGKKLHHSGVKVQESTPIAMLYGTITIGLLLVVTKTSFSVPLNAEFIGPLLYLSIPGTIIAFTAYFTLSNRIGPPKAAFINLLTPIIAIILAVYYEGEIIDKNTIIGIILILASNLYLNYTNLRGITGKLAD